MGKKNNLRIAFLKQDAYQDLYIGDKSFSTLELLFSSIMRTGPIGLFTDLNTDFYIIKEENTYECKIWENVIPTIEPNLLRQLKDKSILHIPFPSSRYLEPGSMNSHKEFSVSSNSVNWNNYDIVISINVAIPTSIVKLYPNTLWCYMIGEANKYIDLVYFDYDVCLNQEIKGIISKEPGIIDFPYTFVSKNGIESLLKKYIKRKSLKQGIYAEINATTERPVRNVPHFEPLKKTGHKIRTHKQNIKDNLIEIYDSKYFLKIGGRIIRGNSVIEAISAGTLVLMNPNDIIYTQLLPKECWVSSVEEAYNKIVYFDKNPKAYYKALTKEKDLLQHFVFDCPLESLKNALNANRQSTPKNIIHKNKFEIAWYYLTKPFK